MASEQEVLVAIGKRSHRRQLMIDLLPRVTAVVMTRHGKGTPDDGVKREVKREMEFRLGDDFLHESFDELFRRANGDDDGE